MPSPKTEIMEVEEGIYLTRQTYRLRGEVFDVVEWYSVGGPGERRHAADSAKGKVLKYLLENLGQRVENVDIARAASISLGLLKNTLTTLGVDFKHASSYELIREHNPPSCCLRSRWS